MLHFIHFGLNIVLLSQESRAMKHIGRNIKLLRESKGLSQDQVSNYLGVSRTQLSYFENYTREQVPPFSILNKLSDLLCVEVSSFLEEDLDTSKINAHFAFRSKDMDDNDLNIVSNFHELVKNYVKMQRIKHAH